MSHTSIVQKLVDKLNEDPDLKCAMEASFQAAKDTGIREFKDFNINSLEDYFNFMDLYVHWIPCETSTGSNVYMHLCFFYFIIDMKPVRDYQNVIDPSQQSPWTWLSEWLIEYAQEIGSWMDSPESINDAAIQTFYEAEKYHMSDYPVPQGGWKTFNDFFARHIDPAVRPIDSPDDDTIIVNPADCTYDGQWPVNDDASVNTFDVKGVPWSISQLLDDAELGPTFSGGVFTHSFLGPADYHRQHAPVSGTVVQAKVIPGLCYLEVALQSGDDGVVKLGMHRYIRPKDDQAIPAEQRGSLPSGSGEDLGAPDTPGYQFIQARGLILIDNPVLGLVAVLPIGMAQVSSVVLSVQPGDTVNKGEEISCFQFGGSDIIMVFQKEANVKIDQTLNQHYNYGNKVAVASPKNS